MNLCTKQKQTPDIENKFMITKGKRGWRINQEFGINIYTLLFMGYMGVPCVSAGKDSACNAGDLGSIPGWEDPPGKGKGYPLQYSGLENSTDCSVHGSQRVGHN